MKRLTNRTACAAPSMTSCPGISCPLAALLVFMACGGESLDATSAAHSSQSAETPNTDGANATSTMADGVSCQTSLVSVKLSPLDLVPAKIFVKLCLPAGPVPNTVQVLVHGITYDNTYWDFADPTGGTQRYSYRHAANAAGFATAAIDRLGAGQSSHPLSTSVTSDSNTEAVHQVISALRAGTVSGPGGSSPKFTNVVLVGHSYGSWVSWFVADKHKTDVDAVVFTGVSHNMRTVGTPVALVPYLVPATTVPRFFGYDPGYLTSEPGARYSMFCAPAVVDPAVTALDEATKGTMTASEIANYLLILQTQQDLRVPALLVNGNLDGLFCAPPGAAQVVDVLPGGVDCTSAETLLAAEQPKLGPQVPAVDAYILAGGGHDLNFMLNAPDYFAVVQNWVQQKVGN